MKIKKKKLLKYLKELSKQYLKEAEVSSREGDYELAHQESIISNFLEHWLMDSIDVDFPEKEN